MRNKTSVSCLEVLASLSLLFYAWRVFQIFTLLSPCLFYLIVSNMWQTESWFHFFQQLENAETVSTGLGSASKLFFCCILKWPYFSPNCTLLHIFLTVSLSQSFFLHLLTNSNVIFVSHFFKTLYGCSFVTLPVCGL